MKHLAVLFALALVTIGCRAGNGQITPNPTTFVCPAATNGAYALISSPTANSLTDSHPAAGNWCYIQQSTIGAQISVPSNIAGPFTTSGTNSVQLTWTPPTTGPTPTGNAISRAPATATTLFPATIINGTVAEVKPALAAPDTKQGVYALLSTPLLRGSVR